MKGWIRKTNLLEEIADKSSEASLYEMLAEEAAELSAAASKYARYLRGEQPVKEGLTKEILLEHVIEEYADYDTEAEALPPSMFVEIERGDVYRIVYQKETKVMYAVSDQNYSEGVFTLLVNENGDPMLYEGE